MTIDEKRAAIIRMRIKIRDLISAASFKGELAQALSHSENRNPCHQIVGKLLTERIRRAQKAARRAASEASRGAKIKALRPTEVLVH